MIIAGSTAAGACIAYGMKKRMEELREFERVLGYLLGEIRCNHSLIYEACRNVAKRTSILYAGWLGELSDMLYADQAGDYEVALLWEESLDYLVNNSHIKATDICLMKPFGQALGYLDIVSQEERINLEQDNYHKELLEREKELSKQMKLAVYLGVLGGIFVVILLI